MTEVLDVARRATDLLGELARVDRTALSNSDLVALLAAEESAGRFADAARVFTAAEVVERSRYELGTDGLSSQYHERKPNNFIEQVTGVSSAEVARRVRIGQAVRTPRSLLGELLPAERPVVASALIAGEIGLDAAHAIIVNLKQAASGSDATVDNMEAAEKSLVEIATRESADLVADAGRHWRDALDPSGIEPRYEETIARRGARVGRERNGIKTYTIHAGPTLSAVLDAALLESMNPSAGPRFISDEDLARATTVSEVENGESIERIVDPRSIEQRRADILEGVLTAGLRATQHGPANLRTIGGVTAVIQLSDLQSGRGYGILEGIDEVIPASVVAEIACDSGFTVLTTGSKGEPLFESSVLRCFTQSQRRAMIARDGDRCIAKGCRQRAAACHAHHVVFFSRGGPTDIDNGVLLCPMHHHALHHGAFELTMIDGMPWIRRPFNFAEIDDPNHDKWQPASRSRLAIAAA
jgi:hypothetical protein